MGRQAHRRPMCGEMGKPNYYINNAAANAYPLTTGLSRGIER
jgi:hypothetical protein